MNALKVLYYFFIMIIYLLKCFQLLLLRAKPKHAFIPCTYFIRIFNNFAHCATHTELWPINMHMCVPHAATFAFRLTALGNATDCHSRSDARQWQLVTEEGSERWMTDSPET